MQATTDNLLTRSPARYGAASTSERDDCIARAARRVSSFDISEIALEAGDSLISAIRTGDEALVGRVLMAARNAWLERGADYSVGIENSERQTAEEAARGVLLRESIRRAGGVA